MSQGKGAAPTWEKGDPFTILTKEEGELCCPELWKLPCGDFLVSYADDGDFLFGRSKLIRSTDGGRTWIEERTVLPNASVFLIDGDLVRLGDRYTFAVKGSCPKRYIFRFIDSTDGGKTFGPIEYGSYEHEAEKSLTIAESYKPYGYTVMYHNIILWDDLLERAGWKKEEWIDAEFGFQTPGWPRTCLKMNDGTLLTTFESYTDGKDRTENCNILMAQSKDGGRNWRFLSRVSPDPRQSGLNHSASEGCPTLLEDGTIYIIYRYSWENRRLAQCRSSDGGKTWSYPEPIDEKACGIRPTVERLSDGTLALSYGRPGMFFAFDSSGIGSNWDVDGRIDLYDGEELTLETNAKVSTARLDLLHYKRYYRPAYTWVRPGLFDGYFWSWENLSYCETEAGKIP